MFRMTAGLKQVQGDCRFETCSGNALDFAFCLFDKKFVNFIDYVFVEKIASDWV